MKRTVDTIHFMDKVDKTKNEHKKLLKVLEATRLTQNEQSLLIEI